jgi:hypothetical protein
MSSEPQVTSSRATQDSAARVLTRRQADLCCPCMTSSAAGSPGAGIPARARASSRRAGADDRVGPVADSLAADQLHRALLAAATPDQVAEAAGTSVRSVYEQWKQWADGKRRSLVAGRPGVTQEAYQAIQARFAAFSEASAVR